MPYTIKDSKSDMQISRQKKEMNLNDKENIGDEFTGT